jgi:hypothetical protein
MKTIYYKTEESFDKPTSVLLEELRNEIAIVRGKIQDIYLNLGEKERLAHIEGLLTCGLIALYDAKKEYEKIEKAVNDWASR